ncbi:MAG: HipA family kinase [Candidatus Angelobacter sp.]
MSVPLHAVQHIRRMRGGSQAHLLRASDGACYVTKFQNSPQGVKILANEMFATSLGLWLGLPMPQVEAIEVSDWLIGNTPELRIQVADNEVPCSSGLQFGSRYPCDPADDPLEVFDYLPASLMEKVTQTLSFARVLVLDKWLANADGRQAIFTRKRRGRNFQAIFIDQGYCLNANEWSFPDLPLHGVYARNCVYQDITGWESFEPTLSKAEQADVTDIWRCAERIVPEWYAHDGDALERIVETVCTRRQDIRRLIDAFRQSSRNPFPNWKEN